MGPERRWGFAGFGGGEWKFFPVGLGGKCSRMFAWLGYGGSAVVNKRSVFDRIGEDGCGFGGWFLVLGP